VIRRSDRPGRGRGYTLIELGVVLALSVLLVFGMVRWLVGVGYAAKAGIDNATDQRSELVVEALRRDLRSMRHCRANGGDARLVEVGGSSMTLLGDPDGDGTVEAISWRVLGGDVQRGVTALDADCAPEGETSWTAWARGVESFTLGLVRGGGIDQGGTAGPCVTEYVARCEPGPVQVTLVLDGTETIRVLNP